MDLTGRVLVSGIMSAYAAAPLNTFLLILSVLIFMYRPDITDVNNRVQPIPVSEIQESYDFVIIGGGSAGSVLANRLSEMKNCTVLLIEAGVNEPDVSDVVGVHKLLLSTPIDWQFHTYPSDKYCIGSPNHQCLLSRGRTLGGSSVLNSMVYIRGNRKDWDEWEALGNPGWNYDSVLPYFLKSEDMRIPQYQHSPYHHTGGLLTVDYYKYYTPVNNYIAKAATELGYDIVDVNGPNQTGFTFSHGTVRDGLRCSAAKAFLRPSWRRKNLHIAVESMVQRILLRKDGDSVTAYGVEFRSGSKIYRVKASYEVILSAGAFQSPQMLMLSGIGPRKHLEEFNITVYLDAPGVGENYQDHVTARDLSHTVKRPLGYSESNPFTIKIPSQVDIDILSQFANNRSGPLYSTTLGESTAFVFSKYANKSANHPDLQLMIGGSIADNDYPPAANDSFTILPLVLRPRSRGYIRLNSTKPEDHPIIVGNFFDDPHDLEVLVSGAQIVLELAKTDALKPLNPQVAVPKVPECKYEYLSEDYLRCYVRYYTTTIYHPCGTCKMGPSYDKMAVVDHRLRVHGVSKLRVVDGSIMPRIISGNLNAPIIMIAEKTADMIKQEYNDLHSNSS